MGDSYLKLYRISIGSGSIWDPVHPKMQEWHHCLAAAGYSFCSTGGRQLSPRPAQCGFGGLVHCTQLLHFSSRIRVPSPKGLCHKRQDGSFEMRGWPAMWRCPRWGWLQWPCVLKDFPPGAECTISGIEQEQIWIFSSVRSKHLWLERWAPRNPTSEPLQAKISEEKHCQRHNGPEGWVHITSSQILIKFHLQNIDQASTSKS